jgi:hypothetical protein
VQPLRPEVFNHHIEILRGMGCDLKEPPPSLQRLKGPLWRKVTKI